MSKLPEEVLVRLGALEKRLKSAVKRGNADEAHRLAKEVQLLVGDRRHHRVLLAKLWAFEADLDANRLYQAENGFEGVRQLAGETTRIRLEATALLAIVAIRQKKLEEAKSYVRLVLNQAYSEREKVE